MSNPSRNSTIRPAILLMVVIFLIASGYLLFNFYFKNNLNELSEQRAQQASLIGSKIITDLPVNILQTEQFFQLNNTWYREYANQVSATPAYYPIPPLPEQITVTSTELGDSVLITWQAPANQTYDGVEIFQSTEAKRRDRKIAESPNISGSIVDTSVVLEMTYYYTLRTWRMVDGQQLYSEFSEVFEIIPTDTTPPFPPSNVTVKRDETNPAQLRVSWDAITDNDTWKVIIRRSQNSGTIGQVIDEVDPSITELIDNTVDPGITYYYTVTAQDASGNESSYRLTIAPYGNAEPFISPGNEPSSVFTQ